MSVASISKFRKDAKSYFDRVIDDKDVLLITRSDGWAVVVMALGQISSLSVFGRFCGIGVLSPLRNIIRITSKLVSK